MSAIKTTKWNNISLSLCQVNYKRFVAALWIFDEIFSSFNLDNIEANPSMIPLSDKNAVYDQQLPSFPSVLLYTTTNWMFGVWQWHHRHRRWDQPKMWAVLKIFDAEKIIVREEHRRYHSVLRNLILAKRKNMEIRIYILLCLIYAFGVSFFTFNLAKSRISPSKTK